MLPAGGFLTVPATGRPSQCGQVLVADRALRPNRGRKRRTDELDKRLDRLGRPGAYRTVTDQGHLPGGPW